MVAASSAGSKEDLESELRVTTSGRREDVVTEPSPVSLSLTLSTKERLPLAPTDIWIFQEPRKDGEMEAQRD